MQPPAYSGYQPAAFVRVLAAVWLALLLYGSLYPFAGWQIPAAPLQAYLVAPWPRYYLGGELLLNVLAYMPAGALAVAALRLPRTRAAAIAVAACVLLAFAVESAQQFLPMRVASNVDLGCNALGALLGALVAWRTRGLLDANARLQSWRQAHVLKGLAGDVGIALVFVWLLAQCLPEALPFAGASLRLLDFLPFADNAAGRLPVPQAVPVALGVLAAGLLWRRLFLSPCRKPLLVLLLLALLLKCAASLLLAGHLPPALASIVSGVVAGGVLLLAWLRAGRWWQDLVCALCLLALPLLAHWSAAPASAVYAESWRLPGFLGARTILQALAALWPLLALAWLVLAAAGQQRSGNGFIRPR